MISNSILVSDSKIARQRGLRCKRVSMVDYIIFVAPSINKIDGEKWNTNYVAFARARKRCWA